jgi:hypothetical protein
MTAVRANSSRELHVLVGRGERGAWRLVVAPPVLPSCQPNRETFKTGGQFLAPLMDQFLMSLDSTSA